MQNDFCPGGALAVPRGDEVVPLDQPSRDRFPHVVLTQDWHPPGHRSFASTHPGRKPYDTITFPYGPQVLWPDHCVQGTFGARISRWTARPACRADHPQGLSPRHRFLFGFLRERSQDADRARRISARARLPRVFLAGLASTSVCATRPRTHAARASRCSGRGCLPRHRCRRLDGCNTPHLCGPGHSPSGSRGSCLIGKTHERRPTDMRPR